MNYVQQNLQKSQQDVVSAVLINPRTRATKALTKEQAAVAIPAALKVLADAGLTPQQAAQASFDCDFWDNAGFPDPAPNEALKIVDVWEDAATAAQQALSRRWPERIQKWQWVHLTLDEGKRAA